MVRIRKDYIMLLMPEDLDTLVDIDDSIYIESEDGTYMMHKQGMLQADDDGIYILSDGRIIWFDYDDIDIYRVREKDISWCFQKHEGDDLITLVFIIVLIIAIATVVFHGV